MALGSEDRLPHDIVQYVIEAATRYEGGFWDLLARGATFKSTGRKRTRPGKAIIAENRAELIESEQLAGRHAREWEEGKRTPVTVALDRARAQWTALQLNEQLVFSWPSPNGEVRVVASATQVVPR